MSDEEARCRYCWLCNFSHTTDAKHFTQFIIENASSVSLECMALQISDDLTERFPEAEGTHPDRVLEHIECHSLHPICKLSVMLRALMKLTEDLQQNMRKHDEDGNLIMDSKLIEMYLKTQTQILTIYKTVETNKLLFSEKTI
jgi:hypothetical protein